MPIRYWILEEENLTYARWSGTISVDEIRENFQRYLADPLYRQGRPELVDLLAVTSIDVGIGTMLPLLNMVNAPEFKAASKTRTIVLTRRKAIFGIARMYQLLASNQDGIQVQVFDKEADALAALGRSETTIEALSDRLRQD